MKALLARYQASRLGRTLTRYGDRSGNVLAGGAAYAALFSIFGALVAGFSIFGLVLGNNEALLNQVVRATAEAIPGLLSVDGEQGAIDPEQLMDNPNLFSTAGAIAFLVALFAGLGWVDALRRAIRTFYDLPKDQTNAVVKKLKDVIWLAGLGGLLVASAVLSMGLTALGGTVLDALGLDGTAGRFLIRAGGALIVVLVNAAAMVLIFRWLAGLRLPFNRLWGPALVGGVVFAILTQFSGVFVGGAASDNPLLATGAVLVTLLVLFNLMSRVVLYIAAWLVTKDDETRELVKAPALPVDVTKRYLEDDEPVLVSAGTYDRTVLAAGAVLGATAALGVRAIAGAVGTAGQLIGRRNR